MGDEQSSVSDSTLFDAASYALKTLLEPAELATSYEVGRVPILCDAELVIAASAQALYAVDLHEESVSRFPYRGMISLKWIPHREVWRSQLTFAILPGIDVSINMRDPDGRVAAALAMWSDFIATFQQHRRVKSGLGATYELTFARERRAVGWRVVPDKGVDLATADARKAVDEYSQRLRMRLGLLQGDTGSVDA